MNDSIRDAMSEYAINQPGVMDVVQNCPLPISPWDVHNLLRWGMAGFVTPVPAHLTFGHKSNQWIEVGHSGMNIKVLGAHPHGHLFVVAGRSGYAEMACVGSRLDTHLAGVGLRESALSVVKAAEVVGGINDGPSLFSLAHIARQINAAMEHYALAALVPS